ncbi:MAG: PAS domain S-box protein [Candidatus Hydrogenedens sp.]|nr:PAS domain S-box protein [Candidatus Hydrogenedens sp.]
MTEHGTTPEELRQRLTQLEQALEQSRRDAASLEAALSISEERLDHVLSLAGDGVWEWNPAEVIWRGSPRCFEMLGYTREEARGDAAFWLSTLHPEDRDRVISELAAARSRPHLGFCTEFRVFAKDGSVRWLRSEGCPFQRVSGGGVATIVGLQSDITDAKRAAAEISMKTNALEHAAYAFDIVSQDGLFLYANQAYLHMWGYDSEEEILGTSPAGHCADPDMPRQIIEQVQRDGAATFEFSARRRDGSTFDVHMAVCLYHDESGRELYTGTALDVSETRTAQERLSSIATMLTRSEDIARVGSWEWDFKQDRVVWSDGLFKIFGMNPAEGAPPFAEHHKLFASEDYKAITACVERVIRDGGSYELEVDALHTDGSVMRCLSIGHADCDETGRAVRMFGSFQDITRIRRLEQDLKLTERRLRRLYDMSRDGFALADIDGRIIQCNSAFESIVGYTEQELHTVRYQDLTPAKWHAMEAELLQSQGFPRGYTDLYEKEYIRKDGTLISVELQAYVDFDAAGNPSAVWAMVRDITLRKAADEALRASEERFRSFVENAHDIIFALSPTGALEYVSPNWITAFGESPAEAAGRSFRDYIFPVDLPTAESFIGSVLRGEHPRNSADIRAVHADGSVHHYAVNASPVFGSDGAVRSVVGISRDVTRERLLEREYRQSQKMEAIGQLTGGVAHDFNNLLQVINGSSELALEKTKPESFEHRMLQEITGAGERAARLVRQLLLFSRRQVMRPEILDLNNVVDDLLKMLRRVIEEHIRLEWVPGRHLGHIFADRSMMEQALMNLCVNARDAMPEGGVLTIESQGVVINSEFCETHSWAKPGRYVLICITDTGYGMSAEVCEHMFEPFFTTKGEGHGTGLGLSTVYGIVTQHEGMITAYSEIGQGSTFKVYLPVCERPANEVGTMIKERVIGGTERIMIVEDDATVRDLTRQFLEGAGYSVIPAANGAEAIDLFNRESGTVDLVILDVVMPVMGGREAYDRLRMIREDLPALFASGYSENAVHTNFVLDEGLQLIQKPFVRDDLLRAVRTILDKARK